MNLKEILPIVTITGALSIMPPWNACAKTPWKKVENKVLTSKETLEIYEWINAFRNVTANKVEKAIAPKKTVNNSTATPKKVVNNTERKNSRLVFNNAIITSYNPEPNQTDDTPCVNSASQSILSQKYPWNWNLCEMHKKWLRPVALTQDRLANVYRTLNKPVPKDKITFEFGERIKIVSPDKKCNWVFIVADAFNARYNWQEKVDIFRMDKSQNTTCKDAKVYKM